MISKQDPSTVKNRLQREIWNQNGVFIDERRGGPLSKKWQKIEREEHKKRLRSVRVMVDDRSAADKHLQLLSGNSKKFYFDKERASNIIKENDVLLRKIKEIASNGSGIQTGLRQSKSYYKFPMQIEKSLTGSQRKLKLQEITDVNKRMLNAIQTQRS